MKKTLLILVIGLSMTSVAFAGTVTGNYVEVRGNDVFVGLCFSNGETAGLVGKEGTMVWNIESGEFEGVPLAGFSVAAVIRASSTLGERFSNPYPIKSVLVIDDRANEVQRAALRGFARAAAGDMLGTVVREERAPIRFHQKHAAHSAMHHVEGLPHSSAPTNTSVSAGSFLNIETREIRHTDGVCANPEVVYRPLSRGIEDGTPVFTEQMVYRGTGLGSQWSIPGRRSGWVGFFELSSGAASATRQ